MSDYCDIAPEFYSEEKVKARKAHRCDECHRAIPIGTIYVKIAGKWDGEFQTYEQHVECRDFAAKVNIDYIGECLIPFGGVDDALKTPEDYFEVEYEIERDLPSLREEWSRIKVLYPKAEAV